MVLLNKDSHFIDFNEIEQVFYLCFLSCYIILSKATTFMTLLFDISRHWSAGEEELAKLAVFFTQITSLNLSLTLTNKTMLIAFPFK